jgi:soluble lytic murein transglycosylase
VRTLWAQCALRRGEVLAAADEYAALAVRDVVLQPYHALEAGRAYEFARRPVEAVAQYASVGRDSPAFVQARWALSRLLKKKGDLGGAMQALAALTEPSTFVKDRDRSEAWVGLAELSRLRGRPGDERRAWLALWATEPSAPQAFRPEARQAGQSASDRWKVIRGSTLIALNLNLEGLRLLDGVIHRLSPPDELGCRAHLAYGLALRKERRHPAAVATLQPVVENCLSAELRPRALHVLGYSQSVVAPADAIETYAELAREYPDHSLADDALLNAAELRLRRGDQAGGLIDLRRIVERYPQGGLAAEALFRQFWALRSGPSARDGLGALEKLEQLESNAATFEQRQQGRYWRARTLQSLEQEDQAALLFEQIAEEGPTGFYGLLSRAKLTALKPERQWSLSPLDVSAAERVWPLDVATAWADPHFRTGLELIRLGKPVGAAELASVGKRTSPQTLRAVFHVLRTAGYLGTAEVAAKQLVRAGVELPTPEEARHFYQLGFPTTFRDLVELHSKAARVDPNLMQALIREESAFNPRARSATGALGLSQLMPATAVQVARGLGRRVTQVGLFDPKQNIRLGSAYLAELVRQFDGNFAYAVASYNAGPTAVNRWIKAMPAAELDEWVENIPFTETRHYVKRVMGSYGAYQLLNGQPAVVPASTSGVREWSVVLPR